MEYLRRLDFNKLEAMKGKLPKNRVLIPQPGELETLMGKTVEALEAYRESARKAAKELGSGRGAEEVTLTGVTSTPGPGTSRSSSATRPPGE
jgi:pyridoxal/pyridoxine/pyridoxamine kinase